MKWIGLLQQQIWWPLKQCHACVEPYLSLLNLSNAFSGFLQSSKNQTTFCEPHIQTLANHASMSGIMWQTKWTNFLHFSPASPIITYYKINSPPFTNINSYIFIVFIIIVGIPLSFYHPLHISFSLPPIWCVFGVSPNLELTIYIYVQPLNILCTSQGVKTINTRLQLSPR